MVEILSPSTRLVDLTLKQATYERAGIANYWMVDPMVPRLTAWELRDAACAEVADVVGDEAWTSRAPYSIIVAPNALTG